jgi:hypothetical protein
VDIRRDARMRDVSGDIPEDKSYDQIGRKMVRRRRRKTMPGDPSPFNRWRRKRNAPDLFKVRIGDAVAELTTRQAVVWLLNLDTMISLFEATTEQRLKEAERVQLKTSLHDILRDRRRRARI